MIGFAKVVGDIAEGALSVIVFAVSTLVLTLLAVWFYCQSFRVALVPVLCSVIAVVWQLGTLVMLGYGIDPLGLLVPFLIFAIGVSHGVQKISAVSDAAFAGSGSMEAARRTFRQLLAPAIVALLADLVGFITILLIPVQVIREMAITASLGVAIVILTDLVLLPVLVSYVRFDDGYRRVSKGGSECSARCGIGLPGSRTATPALDHHRRSRRCSPSRAGGKGARRRSAIRRPACPSCGRIPATTSTATSSPRSSPSAWTSSR